MRQWRIALSSPVPRTPPRRGRCAPRPHRCRPPRSAPRPAPAPCLAAPAERPPPCPGGCPSSAHRQRSSHPPQSTGLPASK
eukprot:scaffold5659_cov121-Isochrysis_galbana.AAC.3